MEKFYDYYTKEIKEDSLPVGNEYDFLLERNKNYMNNVALSFDAKITYEELHERIDEFARALYKRGIRKGTCVGAVLVNTPESVYLLYALKKLEAQVVGLSPLNNEYKMQRDIEMTKPEFIISVDMMYGNFKNPARNLNITPILYSPLESLNKNGLKFLYNAKQFVSGNKILKKSSNLMNIVKDGKDFDEVEYPEHVKGSTTDIMFTGGSSGIHKGVELDGGALNSVVKALDYVLVLEPGMVHLGNIPFCHMCFGRLVLHYCLCKNLEYALTLKAMPKDFYSELVITHANGAMGGKNTPGTVGYPIPFVNSKIVDSKTFKELPIETPGVLLVNGPGMMLRYHENEEETNAVFVYDENGVKWYNTMDVAVKHENGEYEFIGRLKRNFVSGVDNIYPEQIEQLLLQIPEIREVLVTSIPDDKEQFLPSYHVSLNDFDCNKTVLENKIFTLIQNTLGTSALPGYIEYYENALPRTDNGKLDPKAMEEKDKERIENNNLVRTRVR